MPRWSLLRTSGGIIRILELAVARFEVGRLAEGFAAAPDPVGGPTDQPPDGDAGIAKEVVPQLAAAEEGRAGFLSSEHRWTAQQRAELLGQAADTQLLGAGDVDHERRARGSLKRLERHRVGVAL